MIQPLFTYEIIDDTLVLVDCYNGNQLTLTNGMEMALTDVYRNHPEYRTFPVVYKDTDGLWDIVTNIKWNDVIDCVERVNFEPGAEIRNGAIIKAHELEEER